MSSTLKIISEASVADRIICSLTCKKHTKASKSTSQNSLQGSMTCISLQCKPSSRVHLPCSPGSIHRCLDLPCLQPFLAQHLHPSVCCLLHAPLSAVISTQLSLGLQPARPRDMENLLKCHTISAWSAFRTSDKVDKR